MTSVSNVTAGPTPSIQAVSPSQAIVQDANRVEYVTDKLGRRLGVKRVSASLRRRVLKAMSAANGDKPQLLFMAMIACACVSIDDAPVPFPTTELQIDALIDRLEQEGLDAAGETIATKFSPPPEDDLKNS
jgi:hypothetical protein